MAMALDFGKYQGASQITKKHRFDNFDNYDISENRAKILHTHLNHPVVKGE